MADQGRAVSEARRRANAKWDANNLKRLSLAMLLGDYERMKAHIDVTGEKTNRFINDAIREKLDRCEEPVL